MHDLLGEPRFLWHGPRNFLELDPKVAPAYIFRLRRRVRTERDSLTITSSYRVPTDTLQNVGLNNSPSPGGRGLGGRGKG